jgi:hypothetical protein
MDLSLFKPHHPLSTSELYHSALEYIPPTVRREIYKTFFVGFYTIFRAICNILETPGQNRIPIPQVVLAEAMALDARAVQFYMGKGGKVEYVLDATVDSAKEQSSLGDGTFEETFENDVSEGEGGERNDAGYADLGKCSNDLEFNIVRRNIGLGADVSWGPYDSDREEEDGMKVDDDYSDSDCDIR